MPAQILPRLRRHLPALLAATLLGGCGSAHRAPTRSPGAAVTESDFRIYAPARLAPGEAVIQVHNAGPDAHELIIVPGTVAALPVRADGLTVDEETLEKLEVGSLVPAAAGASRTLRVNLAPGHYVFFCNMAGHYMGGMHAEVVVG